MGGSQTTSSDEHKMRLWSHEAVVGSSLKGPMVIKPHPNRFSPVRCTGPNGAKFTCTSAVQKKKQKKT